MLAYADQESKRNFESVDMVTYTSEQEKEFAIIDLEYMPRVIFSENNKAGKAVVKEWTQKLIDSGMSKEKAIDHITGRVQAQLRSTRYFNPIQKTESNRYQPNRAIIASGRNG